MRYLNIVVLLFIVSVVAMLSCKKWEDPAPSDDPRISNPYCNDPDAVNYNWGFPGTPDNTVCVYGPDLFAGTYKVHDTAYDTESGLYLAADSSMVTIVKLSNLKARVDGLCPSGVSLFITAGGAWQATVDTTVGDSLSLSQGQLFCRSVDTVTGYLTRDKIDSSLVYIDLTIRTDSATTVHRAKAVKM